MKEDLLAIGKRVPEDVGTRENKLPEISVIVPVYNVAEYLAKCVQSILAQSFGDFELLLIDDGSDDGSAELAERLAEDDERIAVFHKENGGLSDARNYGVKRARGNYITFIDSDDWIEGNYLEFLRRLIVDNDADISTCYYNKCIHDRKSSWREPSEDVLVMNRRDALLSLLYQERINVSAPGKLYKIELAMSGVAYPVGKHYEDVDTTWRFISRSNKIAVGQEPLYNYVMREGSIVHQVNDSIFDRSELAINAYKDICALSNSDKEIRSAAERYRVFHCLSVLRTIDLKKTDHVNRARDLRAVVNRGAATVLADSRAPRRDKIAIYALRLGLHFYHFAWDVYCKTRGDG